MDADPSHSVDDSGNIEALLNRHGWRLKFPSSMETRFRSHHDDDALRIFRSSLVYLALLYLAMAVTALVVIDWDSVGAWPFMFASFALLIIAAWRVSYSRLIHQRYQQVVCGMATLVVLLAVVNPMLEQDPAFRTLIHIGGVFAIVVVYLGLSLRLPYAMLAGWGGGLPPLYLAHTLGMSLDWVLIVPTYIGASVLCMVLGFRDERQRRRMFLQGELLREDRHRIAMLAEELSRQALVDGLTGLANRRQFDQALRREWARALREEQPLALIFADIDYFKPYNDHFGHQEGDDCMRVLAGVFRQQARRATDLAARYGGEEFVLLLPGIGRGAAIQRAEDLAEAVRACQLPHPRSACAPVVTVSVGVVSAMPDSRTGEEELVRRADQALYQAKAAGRNQVRFAS